ncbi:MAG: NADH dehydrogenase (quinone) subunit D [Deltaproteobacteria bacterium]|nr:NADH dehydrogenase (quinone) subunit D [Deltaproteobacteria bacterium]
MANNEEILTKEITLSMGPQHPSTHGVLHMLLDIKGEKILKATPDIGYLHRGTEKIAENLLYHQFVPYTDRLEYWSAMGNNLAYVLAVEKLLGIEAPERAKYIRVIMAELSRITGHLTCIGAWALDLGAMTVLLYAFREREMVLDLFEMICGARVTHNYLRIGGVRYDMQPLFKEKCMDFVNLFPKKIDEYEQLLTGNRIWLKRNKGIGVISAEDALSLGLSGPILRSTGVKWDIRKDEPYLVYDRLDFDVPVGENGDCFDRYILRIEEMRQAARIIKQALEQIPDGRPCIDMPDVVPPPRKDIETNMESLIHHFKLVSHGFKAPKGEVYASVEAPKGELGFYIISDGSERPFRVKIRAPSFVNLQAVDPMCKDVYLADVVAVVSSLDPVFGEADK